MNKKIKSEEELKKIFKNLRQKSNPIQSTFTLMPNVFQNTNLKLAP